MDEFIKLLLSVHPSDIKEVKRYVAWVKIKRKVYDEFYPVAHWAKPVKKYHWVGGLRE